LNNYWIPAALVLAALLLAIGGSLYFLMGEIFALSRKIHQLNVKFHLEQVFQAQRDAALAKILTGDKSGWDDWISLMKSRTGMTGGLDG
jgi:hypothetical protein